MELRELREEEEEEEEDDDITIYIQLIHHSTTSPSYLTILYHRRLSPTVNTALNTILSTVKI